MPEPYERFRDEFIALDPDRYPADYIDAQVWTGAWRCWGNESAAIIAELKRYPSGLLEVHGVMAAGVLESIVELIPLAEQWGRECGCQFAEIVSLPGWQRVMAKHGYQVAQVRLWKNLA